MNMKGYDQWKLKEGPDHGPDACGCCGHKYHDPNDLIPDEGSYPSIPDEDHPDLCTECARDAAKGIIRQCGRCDAWYHTTDGDGRFCSLDCRREQEHEDQFGEEGDMAPLLLTEATIKDIIDELTDRETRMTQKIEDLDATVHRRRQDGRYFGTHDLVSQSDRLKTIVQDLSIALTHLHRANMW